MATKLDQTRLASRIQSLLSGLRWRIRSYVWLEGLGVAVAWVGIMFWVALAIDYGPVLVGKLLGGVVPAVAGLPEASVSLRAFLLFTVLVLLAVIVFRWIIRRAFVPMADHSMAVLLERQFAGFHDSLVTSVEMSERPDHAEEFSPEMLEHTTDDALSQVGNVKLRQVFSMLPLIISLAAATVLVASVGGLAWADSDTFYQAANRIYLLDSSPWPRSAAIEVIGIEIQRSSLLPEEEENARVIEFTKGPVKSVKAAKGSNVILKVRADATMTIPDVCTVIYTTAEGERGRKNMNKRGRPSDGFQHYFFDDKPLKGILSAVQFEVVGFDHKVTGYEVEVVDNPAVVGIELKSLKARYLRSKSQQNAKLDAQSEDGWQEWNSGAQLPRGTEIAVRTKTNKPLKSAHLYFPRTEESRTIECDGANHFQFTVPPLTEDLSVEITLHDADDVISETPQRFYITALPDQPPNVHAYLQGIGTAVTPQVLIPIEGQVRDDHEIAGSWVEVQAPDVDLHEHVIKLPTTGEVKTEIDFRAIRDDVENGFELVPAEGNKLVLVVKAKDYFDLGDEENIGMGDRYELDIVTSDQLLAILEREEAGQRRRVEQIFQEMSDARDWLLRVKNDGSSRAGGSEPGDGVAPEGAGREPDDKEANRTAQRVHSLRALFAQRSLLQTRKAAQEVLGIAATFRDIRDQLINNRIDAEDRKKRLKDDVADPLQWIGEELFADLDVQIVNLETKLKLLGKDLNDEKMAAGVQSSADIAVQQAEDLLAELEKVLEKLIKYESYAELLDIVRDLIEEQQKAMDATKIEQKKDLFD